MPRARPRRVNRYDLQFKLNAVAMRTRGHYLCLAALTSAPVISVCGSGSGIMESPTNALE